MSGFMTTRGTANLLTKTTRWLAGAFMATSLVLAYIAVNDHGTKPVVTSETPAETPAAPGPEQTGGGAAGSAAPANNTSGTGSTTGTAPPTGTTPSAPAVPTNQ
jgi:preprotein translocase subunit SecG